MNIPLQLSNRIKTYSYERMHVEEFQIQSSEEIGIAAPLLQNRKIKFNHRPRNRHRRVFAELKDNKSSNVNNIERLKKEIKELEREDFISYRREIEDNSQTIKKFNKENSLLVGRNQEMNRLKRPKTTLGIFGAFTTTSLSSYSSAPHKYYSKKKNKCAETTFLPRRKDSIQINCHKIHPVCSQKSKVEAPVFTFMKNMLKGKKKKKPASLDKHNNYSVQI